MKHNIFLIEAVFLEYREEILGQKGTTIGILDFLIPSKQACIRGAVRVPIHASFKDLHREIGKLQRGDEIILKGSIGFRIYQERIYPELTLYDVYCHTQEQSSEEHGSDEHGSEEEVPF